MLRVFLMISTLTPTELNRALKILTVMKTSPTNDDKRASQTLSLKDTKPRIGDPQLYLPRPPRKQGRLSLNRGEHFTFPLAG